MTENLTGDAALLDKWSKIKDPMEALAEIAKNSWCLGGDAYYNDLVDGLTAMAERICKEKDMKIETRHF